MIRLSVAWFIGWTCLGMAALHWHVPELNPDPPLPTRLYLLPCSYGLASRVCVFERVSEARYSEETK